MVKQQKSPDNLTNAQISTLVNPLGFFVSILPILMVPRRADKDELSCVKIALVCKGKLYSNREEKYRCASTRFCNAFKSRFAAASHMLKGAQNVHQTWVTNEPQCSG